jgi:hypothetical protein
MKTTFPTFHAAIEAGFARYDYDGAIRLRKRGPDGWVAARVVEARLP